MYFWTETCIFAAKKLKVVRAEIEDREVPRSDHRKR